MPGDNFKGITSSRQSGFNQATDTLFHQIRALAAIFFYYHF
jgi:hypothetical protein